jgi:hypothetical protein
LTFWDVKLRGPNDSAAARELDVDADVEGRSGIEGEGGTETVAELVLWVGR